ncbi:MAG: hypothetical protein J6S53_03440 [Lentisphaeria bacterium]|nr:hypothetical protein [Lentisphaeria bacterium]
MNRIYAAENLPPPFPQGELAFIKDLKKHVVFTHHRNDAAQQIPDTVAILNGFDVSFRFSDEEKRLETALFDLERFFKEAGIPTGKGTQIVIQKSDDTDLKGEDFRITVTKDLITLESNTKEGIRRSIYRFMDRIAELCIPYLAFGTETKKYWLKNRISRCFFGPIKRPPFNIDELMNDIDYYPEEYLSRLAREGVNGLWLTITFKDICKTSFRPQNPDAARRIAKLRATVAKCLRYGIKTWAFCIEPASWKSKGNPIPEGYPELGGPGTTYALQSGYGEESSFCPRSEAAAKYLYECTNYLFSEVPGLGGILSISHGERTTSCLSTLSTSSLSGKVPCKKECDWDVDDIISNTLGPMSKGMRDANPEAELISWLYQPAPVQHAPWIFKLPNKLPAEVSLAYNFESGCSKMQLGKLHTGGDYWLSCAGPSDRFARMAEAARNKCGFAAKLQVACSHEDATIPYVPAPGLLYEKYKAMKALGVEHVVMCWYFGNYPGLMNRASGMLATEDFKGTEMDFLTRLAAPEWPGKEKEVAEVWKLFEEAYSNYPMDNQFQYYGPVHDGVVWPLHLKRARKQLTRSWKPDAMPCGDTLGECMKTHTPGDAALLLRKMNHLWAEGNKKLQLIGKDFADDATCREELSVANAMDIQFASAANIFQFYMFRQQLFEGAENYEEILNEMEKIVYAEMENSEKMALLCKNDSRLGYHSEAEVYKFYEEKLLWRKNILKNIVLEDFKECRKALASGITFRQFAENPDTEKCALSTWYQNGQVKWKAEKDAVNLHIEVICENNDDIEDEFTKIYAMDVEGLTFPYLVGNGLARKTVETADTTGVCSFAKEELPGAWKSTFTVPLSLFQGKKEILFGLERIEYLAKGERWTSYPAGKFENDVRLNLSYFLPDKLVLLTL